MPTLPQLRVSRPMFAGLDRAAAARGMSRPDFIRRVLAAAINTDSDPEAVAPAPTVPEAAADLDETLVLLSARARQGVVGAQTALLRHLTATARRPTLASDPLSELDDLAQRRLASMDHPSPNGDAA
jgi:hypothetical protein